MFGQYEKIDDQDERDRRYLNEVVDLFYFRGQNRVLVLLGDFFQYGNFQ